MEERLQKILAQAGIASRRAAEKYISEGRVRVNGEVVSELGAKADPDNDTIEVDGHGVVSAEPLVYVAMHKPIHVMTTLKDPEKRQTIIDVMDMTRATGHKSFEGNMPRIFPVGRLDFDAEGLLILTNDGALGNDLLHPRYHVPKTYVVKVRGRPDPRALDRVRRGVRLREEDGTTSRPTAPAEVNIVRESPANTWLEVVIHEGRHHQVKRMFEAVGVQLIRLIRTEFGGIELGELDVGYWRFLTDAEVELLRAWRQGNASELLSKKRGPKTSEMMFGKLEPKGARGGKSSSTKTYRRDKSEGGYGAPRERSAGPRGEARGEGRPGRDGAGPRGAGRPVRDGAGPRGAGRPSRDGAGPRGARPSRDGGSRAGFGAPRGERRPPMRDSAGPRGEGRGRPMRDEGAPRGAYGAPRSASRGRPPMRDGAGPRGEGRGRPMRDGDAPRGEYGAPRGESRGRPMGPGARAGGRGPAPAGRGAGPRGPGGGGRGPSAGRGPGAGARGPSSGGRPPRAGGRGAGGGGPSAGSRGPRSGGGRGGPRR